MIFDSTDFRQFEQYLNVSGLDVSCFLVAPSHFTMYLTFKYTLDGRCWEQLHISHAPGTVVAFLTTPLILKTSHRIQSITLSAGWLRSVRRTAYAYLTKISQRMAENALGILQYLSSDASPLPSLTTGYARPATVFFTQFGRFFQIKFATARLMYGTLFALSLTLTRSAYRKRVPGASSMSFFAEHLGGARALLVAFVGALIGANGLAAVMHRVLGRAMSWFSSKHSAVLLYGPATFGGSSFMLSSSDFPFFLRGS